MILIDNRNMKYQSCATAYNREIDNNINTIGDILIFLHQDIAFDDDRFQQRVIYELSENPNQIIGAAGMPTTGRTVSNLKYLYTKDYITATQLEDKTSVMSVDECCFAMTKELYLKLLFDEKTCDSWHLYAVDLCYAARRKFGVESYVLPETIYHKYDGTTGLNTDTSFLWTMWKLTRKYRYNFEIIYSPCYIVATNTIGAISKILRTTIRNIFK